MTLITAFEFASIPPKPQLHTRKHHNAYNGAESRPIFTWVMPSTRDIALSTIPHGDGGQDPQDQDSTLEPQEPVQSSSSSTPSSSPLSTPTSSSSSTESESESKPETIYEIKLYYPQNRSCTIYRTWDDFFRLKNGLSPYKYTALSSSSPSNPSESDSEPEIEICPEKEHTHTHDSTCLHIFLRHVMEQCHSAKDISLEPAVEFFLRRRIDDCRDG